MQPPAGTPTPPDAQPPARSRPASLREAFEALSLPVQFRVAAVAAVTVTLLVVQLVGALWDTVAARSQAVDQARSKTAAMATRLGVAGGGALDVLDGYPQFLVATFRLESGEVLQRYVRADAPTQPGSDAATALEWSKAPTGLAYWVRSRLALAPIFVASVVDLSPGLSGSVSIVVDHHWIWDHAWRRLWQAPIALLLGGLLALLVARTLERLVAEPLAQLVRSTRVPVAPEQAPPQSSPGRANELVELAGNFEVLANRLVEYERAMSTLRHASAQQIIERTRDLEQRLRKAEALTRSKDDFLANMSHEIRTPMNGVLGMAELLAGTELDKRQRRFVDSMRAAAETMMQIINDILDDSKIEAGKMDVVREPFDVRELAETAGQLYAGRAESKRLEMICRIEPTVPSVVVGDALRLRQVLGNLLSNAVKYTDGGEIEIRVGLDDQRDGQCRLHFSVRDTGPGIASADQSGVFEAFTQLDNGTRLGGTGLGLSIATRLVRLMGGERIDLRSEVGRGSTFSFVLPFAVAEAAPVPNRASDEFSGLRVLVVDDNPTSHLLLEETLANWSAEVTVLNRGRSVGDKMHDVATRGRPFDVVLLDHSLPDATTEQLLRTIRLDPAIAGTYVVLLSALDFSAAYEGSRAIAPDACIAKPVRAQLLHGALQASRQPRSATPAPVADRPERKATTERATVPSLGLDVLVVDDNVINREVAVAMLEELRCRVAIAEDGRVAVEQARQRRFDAILMDCQMPELDGYGATEAIRQDERQRGTTPATIVALTANVMARDRDRCLASGMNSFLAKPFRAAQLLEVLQPIAEARGSYVAVPSLADAFAAEGDAGHLAPPAVAAAPTTTADSSAAAADDIAPSVAPASEPEPEDDPMFTNTMVNALFEAQSPAALSPTQRLPVLDVEQVDAIRGLGKPLVFERLCAMLFETSKEAFARLDAALASGDLEEIAAAAHAFKSPVSNLGGRRLADLLERCETAARANGDLVAVRRAAMGLKAHYAALVAALGVEMRRGTGAAAGTG